MTRQYEGSATAKHIITPLMRLQDADMTRVIIVTLPEATARPAEPCVALPARAACGCAGAGASLRGGQGVNGWIIPEKSTASPNPSPDGKAIAYHALMLPTSMFAMTVNPSGRNLLGESKPVPQATEYDVVVRVLACGVCRTDLHIIDGDLPLRRANLVPGHEVVGQVVAQGPQATRFAIGQRVGIPWLGGTCGCCTFCAMERENLCDVPVFTGYDRDGGFAEYTAADERFCFALPDRYDDCHAAPLLCAGLIGFRAWRLAAEAKPRRLGLYGFGAAAHIICQIAVARNQEVYAFTRAGDTAGQGFARSLGAAWAGGS